MSKVGKQPIVLPQGVSVDATDSLVRISGSKGNLEIRVPKEITVVVEKGQVEVDRKNQSKKATSLHGTIRSLIANAVKGVNEGWSKSLELVGVGFRAEMEGKDLKLTVGYSHPVVIEAPEGISFKIEKNIVTVEGINKEVVGQVAANIRAARPPEPYKGKGIKYVGEYIRRKPGKAAAKATATA